MKKENIPNKNLRLEPIGYISLLDFLHQNKIEDQGIREIFDQTLNNASDQVSQFLQNPSVIKAFNQEAQEDEDCNLEEFGYKDYLDLTNTIKIYKTNNPEANIQDPYIQRKLLEDYLSTYKALDILANKQHAGDRITATISELVQNAIDATAQACDETITPIGKFGMGAKTMFGSMTKDDYLLIQSKDKIFFVTQTGDNIDSLVISQKKEFIEAQILKSGNRIPHYQEDQGSVVTLYYKSAELDSISSGVAKFRYNPNVEIIENGTTLNRLNPTELQTRGVVLVDIVPNKDSQTITIQDQGNGFDPVKLFETSTKNSESRYSGGFNEDSSATIDPDEEHELIMLIQDTVVTTENIKNKERYIPESLTNGIVVENKNYLQNSESRSDWSCNDMTTKSLEFCLNNLIEEQKTITNQASLINTLYLWYEQLPNHKQLSLQNLKSLLTSKTKELKNNNPNSVYLPNLREFQQFTNSDTISLHPDLIGSYSPEKIPNTKFIKSLNGFALWSLPMETIRKNTIKDLEAIGNGQTVESLNLSNVIKLEKSIPPQIWINSLIIEEMDNIENKKEPTQEQIDKYNQIVWLLNTELNEIDTGYKTVKPQYQYYESYQELQKSKKLKEIKAQTGPSKEAIEELNQEYKLQDREYLKKIVGVLEKQKTKKTEIIVEVLKHTDDNKDHIHRDYRISMDDINFKIQVNGIKINIIHDNTIIETTLSRSNVDLIISLEANFEPNMSSKEVIKEGNKENIKALLDSLLTNWIEEKKYSVNSDVQADQDRLMRIYTKKLEDRDALLNELFQGKEETQRPEKPLKQICEITSTNSKDKKELEIRCGTNSIYFKLSDGVVLIKNDITEFIETNSMNPRNFQIFLNRIKSGYQKIDQKVLTDFDDSVTKFYQEDLPINKELFIDLTGQVEYDSEDSLNYKFIKFESYHGRKVYEFQQENTIYTLTLGDNYVLNIEDNLSVTQLQIDPNLFTPDQLEKIKDEIKDEKVNTEYFRPSLSFKLSLSEIAINQTEKQINNLYEDEDEKNRLDTKQNNCLLNIVMDLTGGNYSKPYFIGSEFKIHKSVDGLTILQGMEYVIHLGSFENDGDIDTIKIYDSSTGQLIVNQPMNSQLKFSLDKDSDNVDLANTQEWLNRYFKGGGDPENLKSAINSLINDLSNLTTQKDIEIKGIETKKLVTKEELEKYAKLGSELEKTIRHLNPLYQKNILTQSLSYMKTKEQLEEYRDSYNILIQFLGEDTKILIDNILDIQLRLAQNNYGNFDLVKTMNYLPTIFNKIELLKQSSSLGTDQKSLILFSILSGDSLENGFETETIKIIENLVDITSQLNDYQRSAFDDLLTTINSGIFLKGNSQLMNRNHIITDNLARIKEENLQFFEYLIKELTKQDNKEATKLKQISKNPEDAIKSQDQSLFRFLTTPRAVLLNTNTIKPLEFQTDKTIRPINTTLGQLAIASRSIMTPIDLKKRPFELVQENPSAIKKAEESDLEYNRLATSQVGGGKIETVLRELLQNSKDAGNELASITKEAYLKEINNQTKTSEEQTKELAELLKFTISLNQDIYIPESNQDGFLETNTRYLRTVFCDNAIGIPNFLFNYFNPMKSTKDIANAISAGAFGCGAITINSIADSYEIATQNIGEEDGFLIKVKVIKSPDRTQVIKTEVLEVSRVKNLSHGTEIRIYTKEVENSEIFEIQAMKTQMAFVDNSQLEYFNNPNLVLINQNEELKKPEFRGVYNSDEVQFVENAKTGYWVKNLFVSGLNHYGQPIQFAKALPKMISQMLEDNPLAINFHNKLELIRTRNGFSQKGEQEATTILIREYLRYIANQIFNGSNINIPELDTNLGLSYKFYISSYTKDLKDRLLNEQISLAELSELSNQELIGIMLQMPIKNKEDLETNLVEMFTINQKLADSIRSNTIDLRNYKILQLEKDKLIKTMTERERKVYRMLESSAMTSTYATTNLYRTINTGMSLEQIKAEEKIVNLEDLDQETLKNTALLRQIFDQVFKTLTKELPISRSNPDTKHEYDFVTRTAGLDHLGKIKGDGFYWTFDIGTLLGLTNDSHLSPKQYQQLLDVIAHEVAHHLENLGVRGRVGHDSIFQEFMRLNYSKLLQEIILTNQE